MTWVRAGVDIFIQVENKKQRRSERLISGTDLPSSSPRIYIPTHSTALVLEYLCVLSHLCAFARVPLASMCSSTSFLSMKTLLLQSTWKLLPFPQFLDKMTCSITTLFISHTLTVWTPVSRLRGSGRQD